MLWRRTEFRSTKQRNSVRSIGEPVRTWLTSFAGPGMRDEFTAIIEREGEWFIACRPEIPGANGLGDRKDECLDGLRRAIELIPDDRREDALRGVAADAVRETVLVG